MEAFFKAYIAGWALACVAALILYMRRPRAFAVSGREYGRFLAEPWKVATLYFAARKNARLDELYVAVCAWLFSASWSYDLYLVLRDGRYPETWFANLFASSVIYVCAGLFWNLEYRAGRGVIISFMREGWASRAQSAPVWRFALYGLIFALPAIAAVLMFVL